MSSLPTFSACQRCGCCCHQRPGTILVTAEDIAEWRRIGREDLIEALTDGHFGEMAMPMGPDGACVYLGRTGAPNECSIYAVRATVCREFQAGCPQCHEFRRR